MVRRRYGRGFRIFCSPNRTAPYGHYSSAATSLRLLLLHPIEHPIGGLIVQPDRLRIAG